MKNKLKIVRSVINYWKYHLLSQKTKAMFQNEIKLYFKTWLHFCLVEETWNR